MASEKLSRARVNIQQVSCVVSAEDQWQNCVRVRAHSTDLFTQLHEDSGGQGDGRVIDLKHLPPAAFESYAP